MTSESAPFGKSYLINRAGLVFRATAAAQAKQSLKELQTLRVFQCPNLPRLYRVCFAVYNTIPIVLHSRVIIVRWIGNLDIFDFSPRLLR
jgi:hypothetical protein